MIYCNLKGGLGNMLFQIAATISLSIDKKIDYCFTNLFDHISYLNNEKNYNPNLDYANEYLKIFKNLNTCKILGYPELITYPFHYTKINSNSNDFIIDGFFQSEKYFKHNKEKILELLDFTFIDEKLLNIKYPFINNNNTTSIHVRRGDYVNYPNHHPTQTIDYYKESIQLLEEITDIFVIFSDDIEWCKNNIHTDKNVYIENEKDYIELYLMSLCNNNITSNSSFSWWGAWINKNKNKKVIGPKIWFGDSINHNTSDILPEDWIKI
jgi:hypothetical protein